MRQCMFDMLALYRVLKKRFRYTMGPVFSLVLDTDINEDLALLYPELYAVGHLGG